MPGNLTVSLAPESLDSGTAEEQATFGLFAITANDRLLTEGEDTERGELRRGPYVSGYPLAEWLVWNWWRIRWEVGQRKDITDIDARRRWDFAHRMATVGDGYAWPDITIHFDGLQSFFHSEPSEDRLLFRYSGAARPEMVSPEDLETAVDGFVKDILSRLDGRCLRSTNLHHLWVDLEAERQDPAATRCRRLEAQLGCDPDDADERMIRDRLGDAAVLGEEALGEVAGDAALCGAPDRMVSARQLLDIATATGFDADMNDALMLTDMTGLPMPGEAEAWRLGQQAARRLRAQEALDGQPISDGDLSIFAGTTSSTISRTEKHSSEISFSLDNENEDGTARLSLRSKWETGRRFELARLIGDRVLGSRTGYAAERLSPATRTHSYRQQMQRAFAAEFLSPFRSVEEMLSGDYSEERQNDVADYFKVSPMTISTLLVNHGRVDRDDAPDVSVRGASL